MKNIFIALIISTLSVSFEIPGAFREDFERALEFLKKEHETIKKIAGNDEMEYRNVISIVAPELIRYSLFRDFFETKVLENLYVAYGAEGADFSIGPFQMKPSFIEKLELEIKKEHPLNTGFQKVLIYKTNNEKNIRKERIERLRNFEWQVLYAFCYYQMMKIRFEDYPFFNEKERIQFYASAYNYGFDRPYGEIRAWMKEKAFPYGKKFETEQIAYHEFAGAFYDKLPGK